MKKYDSIIFGNGFNCAVDYELAKTSNEYKYLFGLNTFLEKMIEFENGKYVDQYMEIADKLLIDARKVRLRNIFDRIRYYCAEDVINLICNIETRLVVLACGFVQYVTKDYLKQCYLLGSIATGISVRDIRKKYTIGSRKISEKDCREMETYIKRFSEFLTDIFILYNIHDIVKNYYLYQQPELQIVREQCYKNFATKHLNANAIIMTTNYGNEIKDYYPNVEYMHGMFVDFRDILSVAGEVLKYLSINMQNGYDKFLFAPTAYKKHLVVEAGIYEDDFFCNNNRFYGDLLIFGMSFAKVYGDLVRLYNQTRLFDTNIDNHIMKRIDELLIDGKMKSVTIVAYNQSAVQNYIEFLESYEVNEQTKIKCWYENKIIRIISYEEFLMSKVKCQLGKIGITKMFRK